MFFSFLLPTLPCGVIKGDASSRQFVEFHPSLSCGVIKGDASSRHFVEFYPSLSCGVIKGDASSRQFVGGVGFSVLCFFYYLAVSLA